LQSIRRIAFIVDIVVIADVLFALQFIGITLGSIGGGTMSTESIVHFKEITRGIVTGEGFTASGNAVGNLILAMMFGTTNGAIGKCPAT